MTGWQIALGMTITWFALSVPVAVVVGRALHLASAPATYLPRQRSHPAHPIS